MINPWKVELLGGMKVHHDGLVISKFRSKHARMLFAYLALYNSRNHRREEIVNLLWPGCDAITGRAKLSVELSWLRTTLEEGQQHGSVFKGAGSRTDLELNSQAVDTDVTGFISAIGRAGKAANDTEKIAHLVRAVKLYRGELLSGDEYSWILDERGKLQKTHIGALHLLIELLTEACEVIRATSYAELAVSIYPTIEEFHFRLMKLYNVAGRKSDAMKQFELLQDALRADGGRMPSAEVLQFDKQLGGVLGGSENPPLIPKPTHELACRLAAPLNPADPLAVAEQCLETGRVACRMAHYKLAKEHAEEALAIFRVTGTGRDEANALALLGFALRSLGEWAPGKQCYLTSLALYEEVGDNAGIARVSDYMGYVFWSDGDIHKAGVCFMKSKKLRQELGDLSGTASALEGLGNLESLQCNYAKACTHFRRAMSLRRKLKDRDGIATNLKLSGRLAFHRGKYDEALGSYDASLDLINQLGKTEEVPHLLMLVGEVKCALGEYGAARACLEKSLALALKGDSPLYTAGQIAYLGMAFEGEGDYEAAGQLYKRSLEQFRIYKDEYWQSYITLWLGRLLCKQGDVDSAQDCCKQSLPTHYKRKDRKSIAEWLEVAAHVAHTKRDWGRTATLLGAASALREIIGAPVPPGFAGEIETTHAAARGNLIGDDFADALARGRGMTLKQAVDFTLGRPQRSAKRA